jgi:gamma-glutamyl-gamma-aminobutyrate hydrolase PuuD
VNGIANRRKVYISNGDSDVTEMFLQKDWTVTFVLADADLVCFTGGADINPFIYGERPLKHTKFNNLRDNLEIKIWKTINPATPKVGICRGAQLGNVLCGGALWQHVDGHLATHESVDYTGLVESTTSQFLTSSSHHQMCRLTDEALLFAAAKRSFNRLGDGESYQFNMAKPNNWDDPEAFYYENFNFLGCQFHPEYELGKGFFVCRKYFFDLLDRCFFDDKDFPRGRSRLEAVSNVPTAEEAKRVLAF